MLMMRTIEKLQTRRIVPVNVEPISNNINHKRMFVSTERHTKVTVDKLAERFCIGPLKAKETLQVTNQRGLRSKILPISSRYLAGRMFRVKQLNGQFVPDSLYFNKKTLVSNIVTQVFSHKCGFNHVSHLSKVDGEQVGHALAEFVHDYGAPEHLTFDGAQVQKGINTLFMKNLRRAEIKHHISAPYRQNQSPTEGSIREIKKIVGPLLYLSYIEC